MCPTSTVDESPEATPHPPSRTRPRGVGADGERSRDSSRLVVTTVAYLVCETVRHCRQMGPGVGEWDTTGKVSRGVEVLVQDYGSYPTLFGSFNTFGYR